MIRDAITWAVGSTVLSVIEPDPSFAGFVRNAGVVGSVIAAGWVLEARVGKKIGSAITHHTEVEEQRLAVVKAEVASQVSVLATKLDGIHEKLDACAGRCHHTPSRKV